MFSGKILNLRNSLAFRLAIYYAVIFSLASFVSLSFFYYQVFAITMDRVDTELKEELVEFSKILRAEGRKKVLSEMQYEITSDDAKTVFYRLLSRDRKVVAFNAVPAILHVIQAFDLPVPPQNLSSDPFSLSLSGYPAQIRILSGNIDPETILQIGFSLKENEEYLLVFRRLILSLTVPLFFVSTIIGWFMGRQAIRSLEEVTRTAVDIAGGDYDKRVVVKERSLEIDVLATAFNRMVDRLQAIIKGMYEMTDNIAHDLRSPLARIRGMAEMTLIGEKSLHDYQEMAVSTVEECDNLMGLINTMLDITETESGVGGEVIKEEVDLNNLIHDACELFQPVAEEKNIEIERKTPGECILLAGRNRMQRIIANLLDNALKYTGAGGKVTITTAQTGHSIQISFADTGVGIPEDDLSRIFQRFYRCDHSRSQPGTGLGLSLVKAIVEKAGGEVSVTSILNHGTVFTVTLPA